MSAFRFDPETAADVFNALRLYEGRLTASGRRLSTGAREIFRVAELSRAVSSGHALADGDVRADDVTVPSPTLLRIEDAARQLDLSVSTVRRSIRNGELDVVRIGRAVRVRPDALEAYVDALEADQLSHDRPRDHDRGPARACDGGASVGAGAPNTGHGPHEGASHS